MLYAPEDAAHQAALVKHLAGLEKQRVIATWSAQKIGAGQVLAIAKKRGKMVKTSAGGRSARGDLRSVEDLEPDQPAAVPEVMCDTSARSAG